MCSKSARPVDVSDSSDEHPLRQPLLWHLITLLGVPRMEELLIEISDALPAFSTHDWIGVRKVFSPSKLPLHVLLEQSCSRGKTSQYFLRTAPYPSNTMSTQAATRRTTIFKKADVPQLSEVKECSCHNASATAAR